MMNVPARSFDHISENTKQIIANVHKSLQKLEQSKRVVLASLQKEDRINLKEAIASGKFRAWGRGLFKESDTDTEFGKIWVKKVFEDPKTGAKEEWLVTYSDEEDEMIRQLANEELVGLQKTAAPKIPDPKDIPIAQGIKSKNLTMDETGGGGTSTVTVEFTDPGMGLKFYQDQVGGGEKPAAPAAVEEKAPEEGGETNQKQAPAPPPALPVIQPAQSSLKSTVEVISKNGRQNVTVLKRVIADSAYDYFLEGGGTDECPNCNIPLGVDGKCVECGYDIAFDSDLPSVDVTGIGETYQREEAPRGDFGIYDLPGRETRAKKHRASLKSSYSFVNESGKEVILPWKQDLRIGSQFERPDTGEIVRLAAYVEVRYEGEGKIVEDLAKELLDTMQEGLTDTVSEKSEDHLDNFKIDNEEDRSEKEIKPSTEDFEKDEEELEKDEEELEKEAACSPKMKRKLEHLKDTGMSEEEAHAVVNKQKKSKTAADISDEIPPMGWQNTESQAQPAGAGAALPPNQQLQNNQPTQQKPNVLYDSTKDTGPQFQTTINPSEKSVTVKFLESVEEEALTEALDTTQPVQSQQPVVPLQQPAQQPQRGQFADQEIPVGF